MLQTYAVGPASASFTGLRRRWEPGIAVRTTANDEVVQIHVGATVLARRRVDEGGGVEGEVRPFDLGWVIGRI